ncbi:MAG: methylmalonyl-CoA mutase family protein [Paenisporosarcina sp.]
MTIKQMKNITFEKPSYEEWKEEAVRTLKGKSYDELISSTFEGINLQPLYTTEHLHNTVNYADVISQSKQDANWIVAQRISGNTAIEFLHNAKMQQERGNEMIVYVGSPTPFSWSAKESQELAELLKTNPFYFKIESLKDEILHVFSHFSQEEKSILNGYIYEGTYDFGRTVISAYEIHHIGGTAIHELAYALLGFAKFAEKQESFTSKLAVQFSIDTNFFMEIAKLRAFRILWRAFSKAYDTDHVSIPVIAETSLRSYSKLDSTVNLLRAGNAAFSAVLGGADIITVHPHDVLTGSSTTSERIARNVQLVIREETMVNKFIDPSSGSYYVETLTAELVHQAWSLFLTVLNIKPDEQIDFLMSLAKDTQSMRKTALAKRKFSLIGTNVYSNPEDTVYSTTFDKDTDRLAIPFETLRTHFDKHSLKTAIVSFGVLKEVKPRVDFVQGFLHAGGLNPDISPVFNKASDAWHWVNSNGYTYVVIAANEENSKEILPEFLSMANNQTIVDVAGKFTEEVKVWQDQGLNGTIFAGQNLIEKMEQLIEIQEEVLKNDQA